MMKMMLWLLLLHQKLKILNVIGCVLNVLERILMNVKVVCIIEF